MAQQNDQLQWIDCADEDDPSANTPSDEQILFL
jgi:hypothetical protein